MRALLSGLVPRIARPIDEEVLQHAVVDLGGGFERQDREEVHFLGLALVPVGDLERDPTLEAVGPVLRPELEPAAVESIRRP